MQLKEIQLTGKLSQGVTTLVDKDDFDWLNRKKWYMTSRGYPARTVYENGKCKKLLMHHAIMGVTNGREIDHINRDKLDNRKKNLRIVSHLENMHNRRFSGGVSLHKNGKWVARPQLKGIRQYLGLFLTKHEALKAVRVARGY